MYSEFPNPILVLDTTLEGMFWTPFSCRYKMTCSLPPPTSLSAACITWCWEMHPCCKAEMNHPWPAKSAGPSLPTPWNAAGPRGCEYTLLRSQCRSLSLAPLALAVAQLRKFLWEKQEENAPWEMHVSCEHSIFASDFFPQLSWWDKCRDDKILAYCLFKTKLWDSKMSLLYSNHSPPHTHTILRVRFFAEKSPCVKRLPHCAFLSKVGLVLLKEKPSL